MFFDWYGFVMLGFESSSVINKRLAKIGQGGCQSLDEIALMFSEKAQAAAEAGTALMLGGTAHGTIARYRAHVAENEARLSLHFAGIVPAE